MNREARPNPMPTTKTPVQHRRKRRRRRKAASLFFIFMCLILVGGIATTIIVLNKKSTGSLGVTNLPANNNSNGTLPAAFSKDGIVAYTSFLNLSSDGSKPLAGKVILLDPGHGGTDPGCVYPATNPVYEECNINLKIAQATKEQLEASGATVIMLRTDNSWVSLYSRGALAHLFSLQYANQLGMNTIDKTNQEKLITALSESVLINSDELSSGGMGIMAGTGISSELEPLMNMEKDLSNMLFLSIHVNSIGDTNYHGTQIYYVTNESIAASESQTLERNPEYRDDPAFPIRGVFNGHNDQRNQQLAESLYQAIITNIPRLVTNLPNATKADNYAVLREHNLTSALVEVGFMTNSDDRAYLTGSDSANAIAIGITEGCKSFFATGQ